jgi:hypothetical protein
MSQLFIATQSSLNFLWFPNVGLCLLLSRQRDGQLHHYKFLSFFFLRKLQKHALHNCCYPFLRLQNWQLPFIVSFRLLDIQHIFDRLHRSHTRTKKQHNSFVFAEMRVNPRQYGWDQQAAAELSPTTVLTVRTCTHHPLL